MIEWAMAHPWMTFIIVVVLIDAIRDVWVTIFRNF